MFKQFVTWLADRPTDLALCTCVCMRILHTIWPFCDVFASFRRFVFCFYFSIYFCSTHDVFFLHVPFAHLSLSFSVCVIVNDSMFWQILKCNIYWIVRYLVHNFSLLFSKNKIKRISNWRETELKWKVKWMKGTQIYFFRAAIIQLNVLKCFFIDLYSPIIW